VRLLWNTEMGTHHHPSVSSRPKSVSTDAVVVFVAFVVVVVVPARSTPSPQQLEPAQTVSHLPDGRVSSSNTDRSFNR
jgi:hypothetical protein